MNISLRLSKLIIILSVNGFYMTFDDKVIGHEYRSISCTSDSMYAAGHDLQDQVVGDARVYGVGYAEVLQVRHLEWIIEFVVSKLTRRLQRLRITNTKGDFVEIDTVSLIIDYGHCMEHHYHDVPKLSILLEELAKRYQHTL